MKIGYTEEGEIRGLDEEDNLVVKSDMTGEDLLFERGQFQIEEQC